MSTSNQKWLPIKPIDKRMMSAASNSSISCLCDVSLPSLEKEERNQMLQRIIDGEKDLSWEYTLRNTRLVLFILNKYFPNFLDDETLMIGLQAFHDATEKAKVIKGFNNYSIKYIYGYVSRELKFRRTQLSPHKQYDPDLRIEVPVFGNHQKSHYYDRILDSIDQMKISKEENVYKEILSFLGKIVPEKDKKYFNVLCLKYLKGYKSHQIESEFGISKKDQYKSLQKIRKHLNLLFEKFPEIRNDLELMFGKEELI